jgi:hypothetical protein
MRLARYLSLAVALGLVGYSIVRGIRPPSFALLAAIAVVLIWFPEEVDEYTLGLWYAGYKIETHTPAWMIAAVGWLLLGGLCALLSVR